MVDYQWPHSVIRSTDLFISNTSDEENNKLISEIENYFKRIFETEVILVPSGRAAISILLNYFGMNRSHTIFAPKWTSHCVWDIVTRLANPITEYKKECDLAIAVHKWGRIEKFSSIIHSRIIEDSVDSIITSPETLFPNKGDVEIFSLPKIIGSYTGGLIVVKSKKIADAIRETIVRNYTLACYQSKLRFDSLRKMNISFASWEHCEHMNTTIDANALFYLKNSLINFEANKNCISKRMEVVKKRFANIEISTERLPPVVTLEVDKYKAKKDNNLMIRNMNISGIFDKPDYKKVFLLPLHFGISDQQFIEMLNYFQN